MRAYKISKVIKKVIFEIAQKNSAVTMAAAPRVLGQDGQFRIIENAMGVPGLHVAVNVFSPEVHKRLFQDRVFTTNPRNFVENQAGPALHQCIIHPIQNVDSPWPDDWHRIINAVRDSGLFPKATIPDFAYGLTYFPGSEFECHWDGRGKFGEYVISCSLGYPCTVTFQHTAPKVKPFYPSMPSGFEPPEPSPADYWTRSMTDEIVKRFNRRLWQVTMTLPPNSIYVMSGPSRYDWKHGINVNQHNHPLPRHDGFNPRLFPSWNTARNRRAVIFRSNKVFSDLSLELEQERAVEAGDMEAAQDLEVRLNAARRYPPADHFPVFGRDPQLRDLTEEEIADRRAQAHFILQTLQGGAVHRLRFQSSEVQFQKGQEVRAVADNLVGANDFAGGNLLGRETNNEGGMRLGDATGGDMRLGGGPLRPSSAATNRDEPEVIVIDDSSDEEEEAPPPPSQSRRRTAEAAGIHGAEDDKRARLREARLQRFGQQLQTVSHDEPASTERAASVVDAASTSTARGSTTTTTEEATVSANIVGQNSVAAEQTVTDTRTLAERRWGTEGNRTAEQERRWRARHQLW